MKTEKDTEDKDDYDSPWKDVLENYFFEFLAFFFPKAYRDIDLGRGYRFLDKELKQVVRDAKLGRRYA
ncbi:MAG TPA: cytosolic protein, partial [Desulfobacteraceae bacterium]|nr:cytosolic protein [Desulfobacteraceae bacterium]